MKGLKKTTFTKKDNIPKYVDEDKIYFWKKNMFKNWKMCIVIIAIHSRIQINFNQVNKNVNEVVKKVHAFN
jgi:hypothetical protein